jgi:phosphoglycolate phosphatase
MSDIAVIAFDLDGTLIDSAPDIALALNTALAQSSLRSFDLNTVRSWIGDGPDVLISRALDAQGLSKAPENLRAQLRRGFDATTLATPLNEGKVYEGILPLLQSLHGELRMITVTNKPTVLARAVLASAGVLPFMTEVWGADTAQLRKPSPALLLAAARALHINCAQLLMVGDSAADLDCASAAGCPSVLVNWGYGAYAITNAHDVARVDTPQELFALIHTHTRNAIIQGANYANGR